MQSDDSDGRRDIVQSDGSARKWRDLLTLEAVGFDEICIMRAVTAGGGAKGQKQGQTHGRDVARWWQQLDH